MSFIIRLGFLLLIMSLWSCEQNSQIDKPSSDDNKPVLASKARCKTAWDEFEIMPARVQVFGKEGRTFQRNFPNMPSLASQTYFAEKALDIDGDGNLEYVAIERSSLPQSYSHDYSGLRLFPTFEETTLENFLKHVEKHGPFAVKPIAFSFHNISRGKLDGSFTLKRPDADSKVFPTSSIARIGMLEDAPVLWLKAQTYNSLSPSTMPPADKTMEMLARFNNPNELEVLCERAIPSYPELTSLWNIELKDLPEHRETKKIELTRLPFEISPDRYEIVSQISDDIPEFCAAVETHLKVNSGVDIQFFQMSGPNHENMKSSLIHGRFVSYIDPEWLKKAFESFDAYPRIPWANIPKEDIGRVTYEYHYPDSAYGSQNGLRMSARLPRQNLDDFLKYVARQDNYQPYSIFQKYRVPNSQYDLFYHEWLTNPDYDAEPWDKMDTIQPQNFPTNNRYYRMLTARFHEGGISAPRPAIVQSVDTPYNLDYVVGGKVVLMSVSHSTRTPYLGEILVRVLDPKIPPTERISYSNYGPLKNEPVCRFSVKLKPL